MFQCVLWSHFNWRRVWIDALLVTRRGFMPLSAKRHQRLHLERSRPPIVGFLQMWFWGLQQKESRSSWKAGKPCSSRAPAAGRPPTGPWSESAASVSQSRKRAKDTERWVSATEGPGDWSKPRRKMWGFLSILCSFLSQKSNWIISAVQIWNGEHFGSRLSAVLQIRFPSPEPIPLLSKSLQSSAGQKKKKEKPSE